MVKGETYDKQLFESEVFRHFINIFLNKKSGVTKGCELTVNSQNIKIGSGNFVIQGGFLKEDAGTEMTIPSDAGYYKLVYEIDLSKTNTIEEFAQGNYKFVKSLGEYPNLTQEDLEKDGNIYQFAFCQFRITENGMQDFEDIREFIDYGIYEKLPETLFQGETQENIILTNDVSKYRKLKIYYHDNDGSRYSVEVDNSKKTNKFLVSLQAGYSRDNYYNTKLATYEISGKEMKKAGTSNFDFLHASVYYGNSIYITLVEGYE